MRCCLRICTSANSSSADDDMVTRCPKRRFQFSVRAELADTLARCWRVRDIPIISIARVVHFEAICRDGFQLTLKLQF